MSFFCACLQPTAAQPRTDAARGYLRFRLYTLAAALTLLYAASAAAADLTGPAQVKDADSLYVAAREIRLFGIDAPEWKQACTRPGPKGELEKWHPGQHATAWLRAWLGDRIVSCSQEGYDAKYRRVVATCYAGGEDIAARLVAEGWAFAYPRYSTRYVAAEAAAREAGRGLHAGTCTTPEAFRHGG